MKREKSSKTNPALPPKIQAQIGQQLQNYFSSVMTEPIPDKFVALLDSLEKKEITPQVADDSSERSK